MIWLASPMVMEIACMLYKSINSVMDDIVLRSEDSDAMLDVDARLVMVHSSRLY
jgi:hypothetical protein